MADREYSSEADMFRAGTILRAYGSRSFLTVSPEPDIDKVRFSIVVQHTQGKDHNDFYLDMEKCRQMCNDFRTGRAQHLINADNGQYPGAYRFTAGENGSKHLNIGRGQKGILFQITSTENGQTKNSFCPVQAEDLLKMSFYFRLVTGLEPAIRGTYYWNLVKAFYEGNAERSKRRASMPA